MNESTLAETMRPFTEKCRAERTAAEERTGDYATDKFPYDKILVALVHIDYAGTRYVDSWRKVPGDEQMEIGAARRALLFRYVTAHTKARPDTMCGMMFFVNPDGIQGVSPFEIMDIQRDMKGGDQ